MSEEKPIFPRSSESNQAETDELSQKKEQDLEAEEQRFGADNATVEQKIICADCQTESSAQDNFCRVCGNYLKPRSIPSSIPSSITLTDNLPDNNSPDEQKYKPEYRVRDRAAWELANQDSTRNIDDVQKLSCYGIISDIDVYRCLPYFLEKLKEGQRANLSWWVLKNQKACYVEKLNEGQRAEILWVDSSERIIREISIIPETEANLENQLEFTVYDWIELNGNYFLWIAEFAEFDPEFMEQLVPGVSIEGINLIVKLYRETATVEILSSQTFLEVAAALQKKNDERKVKHPVDADYQDLSRVLTPVINKLKEKKNEETIRNSPSIPPPTFLINPPFVKQDDNEAERTAEFKLTDLPISTDVE